MKKLLNVVLVLTAISAVAPMCAMETRSRAAKRVIRQPEALQVPAQDNTAKIATVAGIAALVAAYAIYNQFAVVDCAVVAADYCKGTALPAAVEACKAYLPYSCTLHSLGF